MGSNNDLSKWFNKAKFHDLVGNMDSFVNESIKNFNSLISEKSFKVNKYETESEVVVTAILPGYKRNQIQLEIVGNIIRIAVEGNTILEEKKDPTMYPKISTQKLGFYY